MKRQGLFDFLYLQAKLMLECSENCEAPQWLSRAYFESVLKNYKNDYSLKIIKLKIEPAVPKGENYASSMMRVKVTYEYGKDKKSTEKASYIVKTRFEADLKMAEIFEPYQVFQTEMAMYDTVLPKLNALLQQIGDNDKLFADTLHVDYENEAIIFEDLLVHNFRLPNRLVGVDMAHAKLTLKKLAKMHATSAVLNEQTKGSLEQFTRGIFNHHTRGFGPIYENLIAVCADFAGNCAELGHYYKQKLLKLSRHIVEYALQAVDLQEGDFHSLNHGDLWTNNIMVRYVAQSGTKAFDQSKQVIKDLLFIDFQFCKWTSPAIDLHYFFNTSLENHIRLHNQDELVQYYHKILKETLLKLDYAGKIPSLHEFFVQMESKRFYAVNTSLVTQTFMINDSSEDSDLGSLIFDNERAQNFRKKLYENKNVQDNAKKLLPFFDRRGLLDINE